jgi:putative inorganic carbon (HCO3(-)) transporter
MQDRYLSTFGAGEKNEGTAEGRVEGVKANFLVAMRKPIVGHGLGTSREANANFGLEDKPSHNLYAEVAQELGFVGLAIFLLLLKSIFSAFSSCRRAYKGSVTGGFLPSVLDAMQVWLWMNFLFSFASYGLHSYEWYLLAGFSVVLQRLHWNAANLDREDLKRPA